ncbi:MAG: molybdenum cofactor guanylyltransferase [bacterium]|nr:molybdenum cofactor guanylyltransferase [bacterium]
MNAYAVGAILIGGASRRMGRDKAQVEIDGVAMVRRVGRVLEEVGLDVVTAGGPDRIDGYPNYPDPDNMRGPLAGLAAALQNSAGRPVLLVAVDQPLLRAGTVRQLLTFQRYDAIIPMDGEFPQVTCAVYRTTCLPAIRQLAAVNPQASIRDLLANVNERYVEADEWTTWGEDGRSWRSIDTPEDLEAIRADPGDN